MNEQIKAWAVYLFYKEYWLLLIGCTIIATLYSIRLFKKLHRQITSKETVNNKFLKRVIMPSLYRPVIGLILFMGLSVVIQIVITDTDFQSLISQLSQVRRAALIVASFWFLLNFIRRFESYFIAKAIDKNPEFDQTLVHALTQISMILILVITVLIVLQMLGIPVSGLIAFGGIGGAGIAFAAKDLLANFFGSLVVYTDKPFKVGDWIKSPDKDIEGVVEHIGMRVTKIRTFQKRCLYVPNGLFLTITVENASHMTHRRLDATIGLRYDDANKIADIVNDIAELLSQNDRIDQSLANRVFFTAFGASSLNLSLTAYINETKLVPFSTVRQALYLDILNIIEKHGAECAFPTQTLHVASPVTVQS